MTDKPNPQLEVKGCMHLIIKTEGHVFSAYLDVPGAGEKPLRIASVSRALVDAVPEVLDHFKVMATLSAKAVIEQLMDGVLVATFEAPAPSDARRGH